MNTSEKLTAMGQEARDTFIKAENGSAAVYFKIPTQVVKVERSTGNEGFSKINRLLMNGLNSAFGTVLSKAISLYNANASDEEIAQLHNNHFTLVSEDELMVTISGKGEVIQIASKKSYDNAEEVQKYFGEVMKAANAGFIKSQAQGIEIANKHL